MAKSICLKAGRLLVLHHLRQAGLLPDYSLRELGDALGVNRSTILRDLRELDAAEAAYHRVLAVQPWVRREYTTAQVAEELGISVNAVRVMIADGIIRAVSRRQVWYIGLDEVDRWRQILRRDPARTTE